MSKQTSDKAMEWIAECDYIARTASVRGIVPEMNHDTGTFLRYCLMQEKAARRDGFAAIADDIAATAGGLAP